MNSCMQLPVAIAIFLSFACATLAHERVDILHGLDKGISWDIEENANFAFGGSIPFENGRMGHKNIQDVNTFADFWSWMSMGLVPLFWRAPTADAWDYNEVRTNVNELCKTQQQILQEYGWDPSVFETASNSSNHTFPGSCPEGHDTLNFPDAWFGDPVTPLYKFYFASVGGMRLRQEQTEVQACAGSMGYEKKLHTGECVPDAGYWLRPEIRQTFFSDEFLMNKPGGKNLHLLSGWSQQEVRRRLRDLENEVWFSPYSSKVELLVPLYNGHVGTLSAVYIVFFVNRAGHFYRIIQPVTFWLNPYHGWWNYVLDVTWLLLIAKIAAQETFEIFKLVRSKGFMAAMTSYFTIPNLIDWLNVFYVIGLVTLWRIHLLKLSDLDVLLSQAHVATIGSFPDSLTREAFFSKIDEIVMGSEIRRTALAMYPIMVVTRFFKAFSAQPRLALVTMTITRASTDLFHFGLVFSCIFGLFTLSAIVLFGQDLSEFANVNRAADSTFHVLLGDFEWDMMKDVGRLPAAIWFWAFMLLVNMVMLNMLLAVIMDVYTEVRGAIGSHAETLWSQAWEILRRWRELRAGRRVSLNHVERYIDPKQAVSGKVPINLNVASFMALVPGLGEKQAQRILIESLIAQEDELLISQSMAEGMLDIQRIDRRVNHLHGSVQNLVKMGEMSTKLLKSMVEKDPGSADTTTLQNPPSTTSTKLNPDVNDELMAEKAEEKLQRSSSWQKPPPWFESFAASMTQRFDRLEERVDKMAASYEARERSIQTHLLALPGNKGLKPAKDYEDPGFCGVSKAFSKPM